MAKKTFKSNIKCMGCVAAVTPHLEKVEGLASWNVDITDPNKWLTVEVETDEVLDAVQDAVEKAGFKAEVVD
jgi:copper chaperone